MKYNVGDQVIDIGELDYLGNPYWYKKALNSIVRVKKANQKYFSIYENTNMEDGYFIAGSNQYRYFFQENGRQWNYPCPKTLFHLEKDRDLIIDEINRIYQKLQKEEIEHLQKMMSSYKSLLKTYKIRVKETETKEKELLDGKSLLGKNKQIIINQIETKTGDE